MLKGSERLADARLVMSDMLEPSLIAQQEIQEWHRCSYWMWFIFSRSMGWDIVRLTDIMPSGIWVKQEHLLRILFWAGI